MLTQQCLPAFCRCEPCCRQVPQRDRRHVVVSADLVLKAETAEEAGIAAVHRELDLDGVVFAARLDDAFNFMASLAPGNPRAGEHRINSRTRLTFDWTNKQYVGVDKATKAQRRAS